MEAEQGAVPSSCCTATMEHLHLNPQRQGERFLEGKLECPELLCQAVSRHAWFTLIPITCFRHNVVLFVWLALA